MKKAFFLIPVFVVVAFLVYLVFSEKPVEKKSQEPAPPYPYHSEDVTFTNNQADVTLSGTLTLPEKGDKFPVVILVSGSGPQDRNSEFWGHKPFLVIADYLTRQGIAVLRYDDRGIGKSTGKFMEATSNDFATDAESAVAYLKTRKEIDAEKIGIAGHSDGGLVAAIAASRSKDIGFIISLAGPGARGTEVISLQSELIARAGGASEDEIAVIRKLNGKTVEILTKTTDTTRLRTELAAFFQKNMDSYPAKGLPPGFTKEQLFTAQVNAMCTPWYQYMFSIDPADFFSKVSCPVLALNGAKDLQVDAQQNLPVIGKAVKVGGNANVTVTELPGLNHFFQKSKTGHPSEYAGNAETFSPVALAAMSDWIKAEVR
ncbi:Esterase EstD [Dyadobacter sp. CECT 9623]|uniref:Esterase EstD n=1 Tax=Dyadobacter linearis TaxID=2823330 RepID=A0ABN7R6Y7_9BACT|nr:alpha/beta hydrolase [Dyadobacter sp. CECT 9623]CAG5068150.1 Esterase EstD [Dyadobacter sp. CECT 9623]